MGISELRVELTSSDTINSAQFTYTESKKKVGRVRSLMT